LLPASELLLCDLVACARELGTADASCSSLCAAIAAREQRAAAVGAARAQLEADLGAMEDEVSAAEAGCAAARKALKAVQHAAGARAEAEAAAEQLRERRRVLDGEAAALSSTGGLKAVLNAEATGAAAAARAVAPGGVGVGVGGVGAGLRHGQIAEQGAALAALEAHNEEMVQQLAAFEGLPPDPALAGLAVEQGRQEVAQLAAQLDRRLSEMAGQLNM
jgi:hypothetical protein